MSKRPSEEQLGGPSKTIKENGGEAVPSQPTQPIYEGVWAPGMRRKPEPRRPILMYRDTEPLYGLIEPWRNGGGEEVEVEVVIPPDCLSKDNKRVKSRQLWGDLVYTRDSDVVAVLMHMGFFASTLAHAPQAICETRAILKLQKPPKQYPSKQRFVKSRAWNSRMLGPQAGAEDGPAFSVERFFMVTRSGYIIEVPPCVDGLPAPQPTVQPQASDRSQTMTRNTGAKGKVVQDVSVQFNLANEPWLKYTLAAIADKGLKPSQLTSARLLDNVLFLESRTTRYQIARIGPNPADESKDLYSFSVCRTALPAHTMQQLGLPLPARQVNVEEDNVTWEEFQWGVSHLHLRGKAYNIRRMHMMRLGKADEQ